jgi:hypothetical protein
LGVEKDDWTYNAGATLRRKRAIPAMVVNRRSLFMACILHLLGYGQAGSLAGRLQI